MPKINVYLPDELADAVKAAGVPVSAVCQRALEQAVRRVTAIRETAVSVADLDSDQPPGALAHFTPKLRQVIALATERARADDAPRMSTEHLLRATLDEGTNLSLHVLRAMEIEPERVGADLDRLWPATRPPLAAGEEPDPRRFDGPAAAALELAVTEATSMGHNYLGCEHLLIALAVEPDGTAGQALRALGAEPRLVRRAVTAALAGYVHLRAQTQQPSTSQQTQQTQDQRQAQRQELAAAIREALAPLADRLARLEDHVGLPPA